jgi:hypothetical protein
MVVTKKVEVTVIVTLIVAIILVVTVGLHLYIKVAG